jgi:uncharacterized Zn-binding protein involved in type VI secretion
MQLGSSIGGNVKRYTITEGATTTAGGKVISASSHGSVNGARIALENDPVHCPACNSTGHIVCVGPRLSERWNGVQVALENDLCACQCYPHPRLVPSQTMRCQVVSENAAGADTGALNGATSERSVAAASAGQQETYDQYFRVKDEAGQPLVDFPYLIELSSGRRIEGRTNQEGKTVKVGASRAEHATLIVYEQEAALLNPGWDR